MAAEASDTANPTRCVVNGSRQPTGKVLLAVLTVTAIVTMVLFLTHPSVKRPADFLQVWSAGRLAMAGENPYDGKRMLELQRANRSPISFASMMWVPPWGIALALPIGALPITVAQAVWIIGQIGLILIAVRMVWRWNGGRSERQWLPMVLVLASGPVFWQVALGQYAGIILFGMTGYLAAHRANRPILAGLSLTLIALKPHLFIPLAIGFIIDAVRTPFGRRVVLGGAIGLAIGALAATIASPAIWGEYIAAMTGKSSAYAPSIRDWVNPTIPAYIRMAVPGHPFWVQTLPACLTAVAFAVYWWRTGNPQRWPMVLNWAIPLGLFVAPYGSWPSDLVLLLIPIVALAAPADECGWAIPGRLSLAEVYLIANASIVVMFFWYDGTVGYACVALALYGCLLWAKMGTCAGVMAGGSHDLRPKPAFLQSRTF